MKKKSEKELIQAIGKRVAKLRLKKNISQADLCYEAEIDLSTLSRLERGNLNFTIKTLIRIAKVLQVELDEFFIQE